MDTATLAAPYPPNETDLESLRKIVRLTGRTTALEFGVGWSTDVIGEALVMNSYDLADINLYNYGRKNNLFELHSVDASQEYINIVKDRWPINRDIGRYVKLLHSPVHAVCWNGQSVHQYQMIPRINPDFIYLDAPEPYQVTGGLWGKGLSFPPIAADILLIEPILLPYTIIVVDGRAANAEFLKVNLRRRWEHNYDEERDQHFFLLNPDFIWPKHDEFINAVYFRNGEWDIYDL